MPKKPKKKRYLRVIDVGHGIDYTTRTDPQMAHTFDTKVKIPVAANTTTNANPATGTVSIASDVTLVTIGIIYNSSASDRLGGAPTIGGVPLTQADQNRKAAAAEATAELWYLTSNIPTGTNLISIPNAPTARTLVAFISTYKAPAGFRSVLDVAAGTGSVSANPTVRLVTTGDGDVIVGVVGDGDNAWSPTSQSGTVIYNDDPSTWGGGAQYILQAAAGAVLSAWTQGSDDWGSVAAAFKQQSTNVSGTVTDTGTGTDEVTVRGKGNIEQEFAYVEYSDHSRQISQEFAYIEYIESTGTAPTSVNVSDAGLGNDLFEYPRTLPSGTFPDLARLLDNFNRESLGSNWTPTVGQPAIVDNKFVGLTSGTVGSTGNEAEWNAGIFGPSVISYITIGNLQPSGTVANNDISINYNQISSTGGYIRLSLLKVYDTLIDRVFLSAFPPNDYIFDTGVGVDSAFTYPQRSSIRIGFIHQPNGYATIYLDRGNGWEAIGSGVYTGNKFLSGKVRLKLVCGNDSDNLTPTVNLDDFYVSTIDDSSIFVTGSMSEGGFGVDNPEIGASLGVVDDSLGGDFLNLSASIPISDLAFSSDEINILQAVLKLITDIGEALDAVSIQASLSMSEDASGQDILSIQAQLSLSDTGLGTDQQSVSSNVNIYDVGGECISTGGSELTGVIFNINLNDGTLNEFTNTVTDGGDLSVTQNAALAGSAYGLQCIINNITSIYGQKTLEIPSTSEILDGRFYIHPNSLSMSDENIVYPVYLYNSLSVLIARLALKYVAGTGYTIYAQMFDDSGTGYATASAAITDVQHCVEFKIVRASGIASNDGSIELWVDDSNIGSVTGKDNYDRFADFSFVRFGAIIPSVDISGTYYVDELIINNDGSKIGLVQSLTSCEAEQITISASIPVYDNGIGIEFITLSAIITLSDIGNGLDEVTVSQISEIIKTVLDTASGLDAVSIQVSLSTTETATGQDAILLQATLGLSDSSVGVDSPEVGASLGITDDALGGDFFDILANLSVSEAGTASDLLQLLASLSVSDVGSGTDAVNVITSAIKSITDSGLGSDDVSISVNLSVNDDGTGTEALTISVSITVLDSGLGTDAIFVLQTALKQIVDSASGSDNLTISASLNVGETSFGIDDPAIQVALGLVDSGEGLESPQISAELTITDSSSATDIISVLQTALKIIQDAGTGTDEISQITASIPVSELGLGSDQIGQILASLLVTDFGTGVDVVVKFDSTSNILKITFELRKPKIVATLSQPAISIELTKPMVKFSLNTQ